MLNRNGGGSNGSWSLSRSLGLQYIFGPTVDDASSILTATVRRQVVQSRRDLHRRFRPFPTKSDMTRYLHFCRSVLQWLRSGHNANACFGSITDIRSQHVVRPSLICGQLFLRVEEQDAHFLDWCPSRPVDNRRANPSSPKSGGLRSWSKAGEAR